MSCLMAHGKPCTDRRLRRMRFAESRRKLWFVDVSALWIRRVASVHTLPVEY